MVCGGLHGRVVELGFGSGLNVAHYPDAVTGVWAVEPSDVAWRLAGGRLTGPAPVTRAGLDGERLDLPSGEFDCVLSTWTLCTIPRLELALAEIRRVLRPGGSLHFLEHGLAPDPDVIRWQRRLESLQKKVVGGCHLTRPIVDLITAAGFMITDVETGYGEGSRPFVYLSRGTATPAR